MPLNSQQTNADATQAPVDIRRAMGFAVAFSPNPLKPPLLIDFPVAGDHTNRIREQVETRVIPMFSANLVFQ